MLATVHPCGTHPPSPPPQYFPAPRAELDDVGGLVGGVPAALLLGLSEDDVAAVGLRDASHVTVAGPHVGAGGPRRLACDFSRTELPLDLRPPPNVIVAHYAFKLATDMQLTYRVMRCAYPNATWLVTSTEPPDATWRALFGHGSRRWSAPGLLFPPPFMLSKFAMWSTPGMPIDEVENHYQKRWLLPDSAATIGVSTALRPSGLLRMTPLEQGAAQRGQQCEGPPAIDSQHMLHDCARSLAELTHGTNEEHTTSTRKHWNQVQEDLKHKFATRSGEEAAKTRQVRSAGVHSNAVRGAPWNTLGATARAVEHC